MQEAYGVDGLDALQDLCPKAEGGGEGEAALGLGAAQLGQVAALQRHHHVVEAVVPPAADKPTDVVLAWGWGRV